MSSDLTAFHGSFKIIKAELKVFSECGQSRYTLDSALFQKFLYYSIDYVSSHCVPNADGNQVIELTEWFSVLSQVIQLLFQLRSDWDHKCLSPQTIISYLSNISFQLLAIKQIPLEWHRLFWVAVFQILALYSQLPSVGPEFTSKVATMGYKILRSAGQKAEVNYKLEDPVSVRLCYELYLLGAAIVSLDITGKSGDGLKLAKDFLSAYVLYVYQLRALSSSQTGISSTVCGEQLSVSNMVDMAATVYVLQPRDIDGDTNLSFYVQLFRLAVDDHLLREKLLACRGDLFRYAVSEDAGGLTTVGTLAIRDLNITSVVAGKAPSTVRDVVLSVLTFVHELKVMNSEPYNSSCLENTDKTLKISSLAGNSYTEPVMDIDSALSCVILLLKQSRGPIGVAISDCLVVLTRSVPKMKHVKSETLITSFNLISLSVDVFVRDILMSASKQSLVESVNQRLKTLSVAIQTSTSLLDVLLTKNQLGLEAVKELAEVMKSVLKSLHCLVEAANKNVLSPDLSKHSLSFLRKAMTDVGTVGRKLTRLKLFTTAIALLSPLWPVTRMQELLPSISHHVSLCESYLKTSQLKEAWNVISKAVVIDISLVTEFVISVLVKILKQETGLSVVKMLELCQDEEKRIHLLVMLARKLTSGQSLPALKQASDILRYVVHHKAVADTERAAHEYLLSQTLWFGSEDKASVTRECLDLMKKAMRTLLADTSHLYDDVLAQAAFLYWSMLGTTAQMDMSGQPVHVSSPIDVTLSPSSQVSSPQLSDSIRENSENDPVTKLPIRVQMAVPAVTSSVSVPASDESGLAMVCVSELETVEQVDSEFLMLKASICLEVWTVWFSSVGSKILETDGDYRIETSLRFLQRVAQLAIVNFKPMIAVTALCRAHRLTKMMKCSDVVEDVTQALVSVIPLLGLKCVSAKMKTNLDSKNLLVDAESFGQCGNLLCLTAVASHHLKTGELTEFVRVRDMAVTMIMDSREKGLRTCSVFTATAILNRLNAEFHFLPGASRFAVTGDAGPLPGPLDLVAESLKNIKNVVTFYLGGDDLHSVSNKSPPLEVWHIIHEYLLSLKLYGDLCLHVGYAKYAGTYFNEGLVMARKCLLVAWNAVFSTCLLELSLITRDTLSEAQDQLQSTLSLLKEHNLANDKPDLTSLSGQRWTDLITSQETSSLWDTGSAETDKTSCSCCCHECKDKLERRQLLSSAADIQATSSCSSSGEQMEVEVNELTVNVMTSAATCDRCFQPELARVCANLMCIQAEILWRRRESVCSVSSALQAAVNSAHLTQVSTRRYVEDLLNESQMNICLLTHDNNVSVRMTLEAVYRLAEVKFQNLYFREDCCDKDDATVVQEIQKLLDVVENEGKKIKGLAVGGHELVASALLLKSCLGYLSLLQISAEDAGGDVTDDKIVIANDVVEAKREKKFWDDQKCLRLSSSSQVADKQSESDFQQRTNKSQRSVTVSNRERTKIPIAAPSGQDRDKMKTAATSRQRARKGCTSSSSNNIDTRTDFEPISIKKPRVVLAEKSWQENVYNIQDIGVESPCFGDALFSGSKENKAKLRNVPEYEQGYGDSEARTDVSRLSGQPKLSEPANQKSQQDVHILSKRGRNGRAALSSAMKNRSKPCYNQNNDSCMGSPLSALDRNNKNLKDNKQPQGCGDITIESPVPVIDRNSKNLKENKQPQGCSDITIESHVPAIDRNSKSTRERKQPQYSRRDKKIESGHRCVRQGAVQVDCESRGVFEEMQSLTEQGIIKDRDSVDNEEELKGVRQTSNVKELGKTQTVRKKGKREVKDGKEEDKSDDLITLVSEKKVRRLRRNVAIVVDGPETMRGMNIEDIEEAVEWEATLDDERVVGESSVHQMYVSNGHPFCESSSSSYSMGCCEDEDEDGDCMYGDITELVEQTKDDDDILLSHLHQVEAEMLPQVRALLLTSENLAESKHTGLETSFEIPRGRLQRKKTDIQSEDVRTVRLRHREQIVLRHCVDDDSPTFEVYVDNEEKENTEQESRDAVEALHSTQGVLQVRDMKNVGTGIQALSTPVSVRRTGMLQELFSPNVSANSSIQTDLKRQRASKRGIKKQTTHVKKVGDTVCLPAEHTSQMEGMVNVAAVDSEDVVVLVEGLQALTEKFQTLAHCQPVVPRIKHLQEALAQLDEFPHSVLYRQICQSLACCLWERHMIQVRHTNLICCAQRDIAAYLTDSMHPTFQHMMTKNFHNKLRKCNDKSTNDSSNDWSNLSKEEASLECEAMRTALSSLTFGGDVVSRFTERLAQLPPDWTVGQVTIVDLDPSNPTQGQLFVTRLTSNLEPITIGLPYQRWQCLKRALRVYDVTIEYKIDKLAPKEHWKYRHQQDQDMQNLVFYLQEVFLAGHKWLLRGQLPCVREPSVQALLDQSAQDAVYSVLQLHSYHISYGSVRNLLEILLQANEKDIMSLTESAWPQHIALTVANACLNVQKVVMDVSQVFSDEKRGPLVLILDNALNKIPWESMPDLFSDTVTRVPSLAALNVMLTLHKEQPRSSFCCGVDRSKAVAVIPPDSDLKNAVTYLAPQFQQYKGWSCLIQKAPTVSELRSFLMDNSLYLYCGHNWGHQYVGGRDVQLFRGRAVAILMGCGSGKLENWRKLDGDGGPLYFLLAGCPAVMGNLWLVTDKDIDKLTSHLFSQWMSQSNPISLGELLAMARKVCKLVGLTGFAPVVYGLPVMMN